MKKSKLRKKIIAYAIVIIAITAICWDLSTTQNVAAVPGTFRLEAAFDAVSSPTTAVNVAIVPSDFNSLSNPTARTNSITYDQVEDMVRKAIELQGGLDGVIKDKNSDGKTQVMLKPNIVEKDTPSGNGTNTDVRVIKALIKIIGEHTSGVEIIVAEGSPRAGYDDPTSSTSCWESTGYRALLSDSHLSGINFSLFNLNQPYSDLVEVDLGDAGTAAPHNYKYKVHKKEIEVDVYITVPVLKIHDTGMTNALKNQIGTAPGSYYGYNKTKGTSYYGGLVHDVSQRRWTTEEIVDFCQVAGIDFVVVDAIMCLESSKSYNGSNQVRFNTIVAGWDPVAVDHVCTKMLCLNPDDIAHITLAEKVGIGTNNQDYINVVGASIDDVKKKVKKNTTINGEFGQSNRTWLLSKAYAGENISVQHIASEATYIPESLKDDWSAPTYFFDDRIDLTSYYNGQTGIISYAFTYFYAPENKQAELWIGYDEDIKVYLDGTEVFSYTGLKNYSGIVQNKIDINIKKGENTLLVKTKQKYNTYEFALNICEPESTSLYAGNRVPGLKFYSDTITVTDPVDPPDTTGVTEVSLLSTDEISLSNYPNPFTDFTTFKFTLPVSGNATISVYDLNGRLVENLTNNYYSAGTHEISWDAGSMKAGYYFCIAKTGNYSESIKLIVE